MVLSGKESSLPEYTWSGGGKTRETTTDQVVWLLLLGGWMVSWSSYYLNPKQHSVLHLGQPKCKSKSRVTGHTKKTIAVHLVILSFSAGPDLAINFFIFLKAFSLAFCRLQKGYSETVLPSREAQR